MGMLNIASSKIISLPTDQLTYTVNGLAMQVHNELGAGHAEKFYQRRLADLCEAAGIGSGDWKSGWRFGWMANQSAISNLDLWVDERLVVECKSFSHSLGVDDDRAGVDISCRYSQPDWDAYTTLGEEDLNFKRILQPKDVQDWQKHLYRFIHQKPWHEASSAVGDKGISVPPIRFKSTIGKPNPG